MDKDAKQQMLMDENLSDEKKMQILANRKMMGGIIKKDEPVYKNVIRICIFLLVIPFIILSELYDAIKTNSPLIWSYFITLLKNAIEQMKEIAFKLYKFLGYLWQNKSLIKDLYFIVINYLRILGYKFYEKLLLFVNLRIYIYDLFVRLGLRIRIMLKLIQKYYGLFIIQLTKVASYINYSKRYIQYMFTICKQFTKTFMSFLYEKVIKNIFCLVVKIYKFIVQYLVDTKDSGKVYIKRIWKIVKPILTIVKNYTLIIYIWIKLQTYRFFSYLLLIQKQCLNLLKQKVITLIGLVQRLFIDIKNKSIWISNRISDISKRSIEFIRNSILKIYRFSQKCINKIWSFIVNSVWIPFYQFIAYLQEKVKGILNGIKLRLLKLQDLLLQYVNSFINYIKRLYHFFINKLIEIIQTIKLFLLNQLTKFKNYLINHIVNPTKNLFLKIHETIKHVIYSGYKKISQAITNHLNRINNFIKLQIKKVIFVANLCINKLKNYGNLVFTAIKQSLVYFYTKLYELISIFKVKIVTFYQNCNQFITLLVERLKRRQNPFKIFFRKYIKPIVLYLFDKLTKGALMILEKINYFVHQVIYRLCKKIKRQFVKLTLKLLNILEKTLLQLNDAVPTLILWLYDWIEFIIYQVYRLIHFIIIRPLLWLFRMILSIAEYALEKSSSVAKKTKYLLIKFYYEIKEQLLKLFVLCKNVIKSIYQNSIKPLMNVIALNITKNLIILKANFVRLIQFAKVRFIQTFKLCVQFSKQLYKDRIKPLCIQLVIQFKFQIRAFRNFTKLSVSYLVSQFKLVKLQSRILMFQIKSLSSIYYNNTIKPILIQAKTVLISMKNQMIQILILSKAQINILINQMKVVVKAQWIQIKVLGNQIKIQIKSLVESAKIATKNAIQLIKENLSILKELIKQGSKQGIQICKQNIQITKAYATQIKEYFSQQLQSITESINQQWQPVKMSITNQKDQIVEIFKQYQVNIKEIIQNLKNQSKISRYQVRDELKQQKLDLKIKKQEVKQDLRAYKQEVIEQLKTK